MGSSADSFGTLKPNPQALERVIEKHLDSLPSELRKGWQEQYDNAEDSDLATIEKSLRHLVRERERALVHSSRSLGELKHTEKDMDKIYATLARIGEASEHPELFVGKGKTGEVHRDVREPDLCYKTIINFVSYDAWNSIDKEAHYLEELEDFIVEGVRTPRVQFIVDLPEVKAIAMEYLDAKNVEIIIRKKLPLPENFDVKDFFRRVRAYIDEMHKQKNIYHRDLHGGNILVGADGTPYIIDFGQSARAFTAENAYDIENKVGQKQGVLTSDEEWLTAVESNLSAYAITPYARRTIAK